MIIAIDGPSGAGKSTVAKLISKNLNFEYIDTGAMYRALAYKAFKSKTEINDELVKDMLLNTVIDYSNNSIFLDGENIDNFIRDEIISIMASKISALKSVRNKMVFLQRNIAKDKNVILDGRDIGTNVFPNAEFKFFITASLEERAERRYNELLGKCMKDSYDNVLKDIQIRDYNDSTRKIAPLIMAKDAILIDTSSMGIQETVNKILSIIREKIDVL